MRVTIGDREYVFWVLQAI